MTGTNADPLPLTARTDCGGCAAKLGADAVVLFTALAGASEPGMIRTLAATSDEAIRTTAELMREQGIKIAKEKDDKGE